MERGGGGDSIPGESNRIVVGCAGWSSFRPKLLYGEDWKERFRSVLQAYSSVFNFVEINSTFYRLPRVETARRWREEVGESFLFSMKVPRSITHEKKFKGIAEDVERMLEVAKALRTFFILFQTAKSFTFSEERLKLILDLLETLPKGFTYGFELRGWKDEEIMKLLDRADVVHVVDPFDRNPLSGNPYYFRLHGSPPGERMYSYKYTDRDLKWLKGYVEKLEGEIYVVFNNVWMCDDAMRFKDLLERP